MKSNFAFRALLIAKILLACITVKVQSSGPRVCMEGIVADVRGHIDQSEACLLGDGVETACLAVYVRSALGTHRLIYQCTNHYQCPTQRCYFQPGRSSLSLEVSYVCCCFNGSKCNNFNPYHRYLDWVKHNRSSIEPPEVDERFGRMNASKLNEEATATRKAPLQPPLKIFHQSDDDEIDVLHPHMGELMSTHIHGRNSAADLARFSTQYVLSVLFVMIHSSIEMFP